MLFTVRLALVFMRGCDRFGCNAKVAYERFSSKPLKPILIAELMMIKSSGSMGVSE